MERARQQQSVTLDRGLFLVRYVTAEDAARPPIVKVAADPASNKDISFLLHPDHTEAALWQPDSCLVVRAKASGKLSVEVVPTYDGGSAAATVRIESLTQSKAPPPLAQTMRQGTSRYDLKGLRILAHVTGIGDQLVNANEWIAGPSAPLRIEGISMAWPNKPEGLEIRYAVKTAKPQTLSGRAMNLGSFAGTRGKAMPIVGLMLELSGPAAANVQFTVEAIFLGSPTTRVTGKRVVASGPTGREPLVGLRLAVENVPAAKRPHATMPLPATQQPQTKASGSPADLPQAKSPVPVAKGPRAKSSARAKSSTTRSGRTPAGVRVVRNRLKPSQTLLA